MTRIHRLLMIAATLLGLAILAESAGAQGDWAMSQAACRGVTTRNDDASWPPTASWDGLGVSEDPNIPGLEHEVSGDGWAGECFEVTLCHPRVMRFQIKDLDFRPGHCYELWIDGQKIGVTPAIGEWGYKVCAWGHYSAPSSGEWVIGFGTQPPPVVTANAVAGKKAWLGPNSLSPLGSTYLPHADGQVHQIRIRFAGFDNHVWSAIHDSCMIAPNCAIRWDWMTPKVTVKGRFMFPDSSLAIGMRNVQLGLFDQQGSTYRDLGVRAAADRYGYFRFPCIDNLEEDGSPYDLKVRAWFTSDPSGFTLPPSVPPFNPVTMVHNDGNPWFFDSVTKTDCVGMDTNHWELDFGNQGPTKTDYGYKSALHIYSTMLKGWEWVYDRTKDSAQDIMTPTTVKWDWEINDTTLTSGSTITIAGMGNRSAGLPDEWDDDVLLHEYGHRVAFRYNFLSPVQVQVHYFTQPIASSQAAWDEGWATFFARAVWTDNSLNPGPTRQNVGWDKNSTIRSKETVNLEDGTYKWENPFPAGSKAVTANYNDRGDTWELPVAGALWDIMDAANDDQPGTQLCGDNADNYTDTAANIFKACRNMASVSLKNVHTFYHAYAQLPGVDRSAVIKLFCEHGIDVRQDSPERIGTDPPPVVSADPTPTNVLYPGQPNPLRLGTVIEFSLAAPAQTDLEVFDVRGRLVRTLIRAEKREAGRYSVPWDGRDFTGSSVRPGVYLYRLVTDRFRAEKKLIVIP